VSDFDCKKMHELVDSIETTVLPSGLPDYFFPDIKTKLTSIMLSLSYGLSFEEMVAGIDDENFWLPFSGLTREHVAAACYFYFRLHDKKHQEIAMVSMLLKHQKELNKILIDFIKAFDPEAAKEFSKSPLERLDELDVEKTVH
jgi:hypothetical protein